MKNLFLVILTSCIHTCLFAQNKLISEDLGQIDRGIYLNIGTTNDIKLDNKDCNQDPACMHEEINNILVPASFSNFKKEVRYNQLSNGIAWKIGMNVNKARNEVKMFKHTSRSLGFGFSNFRTTQSLSYLLTVADPGNHDTSDWGRIGFLDSEKKYQEFFVNYQHLFQTNVQKRFSFATGLSADLGFYNYQFTSQFKEYDDVAHGSTFNSIQQTGVNSKTSETFYEEYETNIFSKIAIPLRMEFHFNEGKITFYGQCRLGVQLLAFENRLETYPYLGAEIGLVYSW